MTAPLAAVILADSSPESVAAGVSLARRLPATTSLAFAPRDRLHAALEAPAHARRDRPYRLIVVGADLPVASRLATVPALARDPASTVDWIDANLWSDTDAVLVRRVCRGGAWFNDPSEPSPFRALGSAAGSLGLRDDPFSEALQKIARCEVGADRRLLAWRDALEGLRAHPLELPASVAPLVAGDLEGMLVPDRLEAEALRHRIDELAAGTSWVRFPVLSPTGGRKTAVLVVLPSAGAIPAESFAHEAIDRAGADLAVVLADRGNVARIVGRRRPGGAEEVAFTETLLRRLPWVVRDRLRRDLAGFLWVDPPTDAITRFVAALTAP